MSNAEHKEALLTGVILGMVLMALVSWLIGAALVGAAAHGDWIISAPDALRWMLIIWILGCGEGWYGGWWYHYRMPPAGKQNKKRPGDAGTSTEGRAKNSTSFYIGQRRKSRRNRNAGNDHRWDEVC